jgi:hypothetical protein
MVVNNITTGATIRLDRSATQYSYAGLRADIVYRFTVTAMGTRSGMESAAASAAPTASFAFGMVVQARAIDSTTIAASWTPPTNDGGLPVTGYNACWTTPMAYVLMPETWTCTRTTARSAVFTGVTPGIAATVTVSAINGVTPSREYGGWPATGVTMPAA